MVAEATAPRRENVPMAHSFLYRTHSIDTHPPLQKEEQASKPWGESDGQPDASSGIHDSPPGKGRTWGRHHQEIPEVAVIGTPFFNGLPEGIKRAVAAVVAGLITLLLFTLNPSVKALAMGFQGALGTDFMVPSYLAVSYIRDFLEEMKHMEL